MERTTPKEYWKIIRKNSKEKANKKLGIGIRMFAVALGILSTAISSWLLGKGSTMEIIKIASVTITVNIFLWIIAWICFFIYYKILEPIILYNLQEEVVEKLRKENESFKDTKTSEITIRKNHICSSCGYGYPLDSDFTGKDPSLLRSAGVTLICPQCKNREPFPLFGV
jgi:hypothetical protein